MIISNPVFFVSMLANFSMACRLMLIRFDEAGGVWVALKYSEEGEVEVPSVEGPCQVDAISGCPELRQVLVQPTVELPGEGESVLVFDSKPAPLHTLDPTEPSFAEGQLVWVAPKSPRLDDLLIESNSKGLLAFLHVVSREFLQGLFSEGRAEFVPRVSPLVVKGLPNLGSTCYFNSALQLLFRISLFREFIKEAPMAFPCLAKDSVTFQLSALFHEMEEPGNIRAGIPEEALEVLMFSVQKASPVKDLMRQNDPEEAITSILGAVSAETDAGPWRSSSTVRQMAEVRMTEVDHCMCGQRDAQTPILANSLKLENLKANQPDDLERLVEESLKPSPLPDVHGHADHLNLRTLYIDALPPILVFHVNRRTEYGGKNAAQVHFPISGLDMTRYVRGYAGPPLVYDFVAASLHAGDIQSGHYTTGLTLPGGCWYEISDAHHGDCYWFDDRYRAVGENAVLLVYQLRATISEEERTHPPVQLESFNKTEEQAGSFDYAAYAWS
jgi:hypothetical protein